jgi:diadenosine tetraphosphate (Ap4A) HIT family hydrolase
MSDCLFCKLEKVGPDAGLPATRHFFVRYDIHPQSPGHALVIAKRHVESLFDLSKEEWADLQGALAKTKSAIDFERKPAAYNVTINDGRAAGRIIDHLHVHVVPRYAGGAEKTHDQALAVATASHS